MGVCGARRLENKNNSGFQNSEFVLTDAGVRTIRNNNYSYDVPLGRPESGIIIIRTVEASTGFRNNNYSYDVSLLYSLCWDVRIPEL